MCSDGWCRIDTKTNTCVRSTEKEIEIDEYAIQIGAKTILYHLSVDPIKEFKDDLPMYASPDLCQSILHIPLSEPKSSKKHDDDLDVLYLYKWIVEEPFQVLVIQDNNYPVVYGDENEMKTMYGDLESIARMDDKKGSQYTAKDLINKHDVVNNQAETSSIPAIRKIGEAFCRWAGENKLIGWRQPYDQNEVHVCAGHQAFNKLLTLDSVFELARSNPGEFKQDVRHSKVTGLYGKAEVDILASWRGAEWKEGKGTQVGSASGKRKATFEISAVVRERVKNEEDKWAMNAEPDILKKASTPMFGCSVVKKDR